MPGSRFQVPDFRSQVAGDRFQMPGSKSQVPAFKFPGVIFEVTLQIKTLQE